MCENTHSYKNPAVRVQYADPHVRGKSEVYFGLQMKTVGECVCYSLCWPTACSALCCWGPMLAPPSPVICRMSLMIDCLSTAAGKDTGRESENRPG